jgi:preprotein translocase subunit SecD
MAQKVDFGIYETVNLNQLPGSVIENLKSTGIQFEENKEQSVIGYLLESDTSDFQCIYQKENIRLIKTYYTIDNERKYRALFAVKFNPVLSINDISNTKVTAKNVEIHFNMEGAKKWAGMTKGNIGKTVAFVVDNQVYTSPLINAEIKGGVALINGLNDETLSKKISDLLNSGITD